MASEFKINKQGIAKLQRELEREFARNPIRVPIVAEASIGGASGGMVVNYNGPVVTVNGDHAQLAWSNDTVTQSQSGSEIAPGFADVADVVTKVLAALQVLGFSDGDANEVREQAEIVLKEVTKEQPDAGVVKRAVTMLKGLLAAAGAGVAAAVTTESAEVARGLIEALSGALAG